jgi:gas vesicle structural protein
MDEFRNNSSRDVPLVELLDRVVGNGVVLSGDIMISVADVNLIYVGLRVLIRSAEPEMRQKSSLDSSGEPGIDGDDSSLHLRGDQPRSDE